MQCIINQKCLNHSGNVPVTVAWWATDSTFGRCCEFWWCQARGSPRERPFTWRRRSNGGDERPAGQEVNYTTCVWVVFCVIWVIKYSEKRLHLYLALLPCNWITQGHSDGCRERFSNKISLLSKAMARNVKVYYWCDSGEESQRRDHHQSLSRKLWVYISFVHIFIIEWCT